MTPNGTPSLLIELSSDYLSGIPCVEGTIQAHLDSLVTFPDADTTLSCVLTPSAAGSFTFNPYTGEITLSNITAVYVSPVLMSGEVAPAMSHIYAMAVKGVGASDETDPLGEVTITYETDVDETSVIFPPDGSFAKTIPLGLQTVATTRVVVSVATAATNIELAIIGKKA